MPKAEKGSAKDIGKRIKSKGLQKLKFYCQQCEKQCRDANGFKCHLTSENHLRQMKVFSENAKGIMDRYSKEFEHEFITTLRQRHTTKRVNANNVYQEVISDKMHIHMNSTRWSALADFVMYLGKSGKCVVDETERGWYVQYIENDVGILARKEAQERRAEAEKQAELAQAQRMAHQRVEAAKALDRVGGVVHLEATNLERNSGDDVVTMALKTNNKVIKAKAASNNTGNKKKGNVFGEDDEDEDEQVYPKQPSAPLNLPPPKVSTGKVAATSNKNSSSSGKRPADVEDKPNNNNNNKRQKLNAITTTSTSTATASQSKSKSRDDNNSSNRRREQQPWLKRDIIVRIINKKLANGKYFRRKAVVDHVLKDDKFRAEVEVFNSTDDKSKNGDDGGGDILRLDQNDLETVVPKEGKLVRLLKGAFRGKKATVVGLDKRKYRATLKLINDKDKDEAVLLDKIDFEDFSQLA